MALRFLEKAHQKPGCSECGGLRFWEKAHQKTTLVVSARSAVWFDLVVWLLRV